MRTIVRFEIQELCGHDSIMIDIITFFAIVFIVCVYVSKVTFGPIRDAANA